MHVLWCVTLLADRGQAIPWFPHLPPCIQMVARQGIRARGEGGRCYACYACLGHESTLLPQDVEVLPTFDALGLKEDLLRGVYAYGHLASHHFWPLPEVNQNTTPL